MEPNNIIFDTYQIDADIAEKSESILQGSKFISYAPQKQSEGSSDTTSPNGKYIANIIADHFKYSGILSEDLIRVNFGLHIYSNKDKYIGEWVKDVKEGLGVYHFNVEGDKEQQLYFGNWTQGSKKGKGIYLWKHSSASEPKLTSCSYDAFFGDFDGDAFTQGISLQKTIKAEEPTDYIIYSGAMTKEGKKEDANAVLIENDNVFHGRFADDQMVKGNVVVFEQDKESKEEKAKTSYGFEKKQGVDDYKFEPRKENDPNEVDRAFKAKAKLREKELFSFIESLFEQYLSLENDVNTIEFFNQAELPSVFKMLKNFFNDESNFTLL